MAAALLIAAPAWCQFEQYVVPGELARREAPTKEQVEEAMAAARWGLGPIRLLPWVGVRGVTWYDDVDPATPGKQSDVSAQAGAGLAGFLPLGEKLVLAGYALPEYQWWRDQDERRGWIGRYGLGMVGYFNRLTVEVLGSRDEAPRYASAEAEVPVDVRRDWGRVNVELGLSGRLAVYAGGGERRWRYPGPEAGTAVRDLERDERRRSAGLRWRPRRGVTVSAGAERSEVDFLDPADDRSASGDGVALGLSFEGRRSGLEAEAVRWTLDPERGATFAPFDGTTGRGRLWWEPSRRTEWSVYANRSIGFSVRAASMYYVQRRVGTAFSFPLGWRTTGTVFGETGSNDYVGTAAGFREDAESYGARLSITVFRASRLEIGAWRERYDSPVPGGDRDVTRIVTSLAFGGAAPAPF